MYVADDLPSLLGYHWHAQVWHAETLLSFYTSELVIRTILYRHWLVLHNNIRRSTKHQTIGWSSLWHSFQDSLCTTPALKWCSALYFATLIPRRNSFKQSFSPCVFSINIAVVVCMKPPWITATPEVASTLNKAYAAQVPLNFVFPWLWFFNVVANKLVYFQ